jgi:penicillin-insensitive murein endopeptidase
MKQALAFLLTLLVSYQDKPVHNPWAQASTSKDGPTRIYGKYTAGCIQGAASLPADGSGYQVMRLSRRRTFGHPDLIEFVKGLAARVDRAGLAMILVGDLGMARGGPTLSGHVSHQNGLDVDIWYTHPRPALNRSLTLDEREMLSSPAIVNMKKMSLNGFYTPRIVQILRWASEDPRVERIFVHATVKRRLCQQFRNDRTWLRKIRPWWGHHDHFHVRLKCPLDSPNCMPQDPVSAGPGCNATLDWWFSEEAAQEWEKIKAKPKTREMPALPSECREVIQ